MNTLQTIMQTTGWILRQPIGKRQPLRSLFRYFSWQLQSRMPFRIHSYGWVNGTRMYIEPRHTGASGEYYVGLREFADQGFALHFLRAGDYFVDIGANVGSFTVIAGALGARVTAFEPVPKTFDWLQKNIDRNGIASSTESVNAAVGARDGKVRFTSGRDMNNQISESGDIEVPITKLDSALSACPILIKMDTEGHEEEVIKGASRWISSPDLKCVIGSIYHGSEADQLLLDAGFVRRHYDPFTRQLGKSIPGDDQIFIRDMEFAMERLRTAPPFRVRGYSI